jgi:hypothetical protein
MSLPRINQDTAAHAAAEDLTGAMRIQTLWFKAPVDQNGDNSGITAVRAKARDLAMTILEHVPSSADRQAALRKLREAVRDAEWAIEFKGR